jgi:hypothetical protein
MAVLITAYEAAGFVLETGANGLQLVAHIRGGEANEEKSNQSLAILRAAVEKSIALGRDTVGKAYQKADGDGAYYILVQLLREDGVVRAAFSFVTLCHSQQEARDLGAALAHHRYPVPPS